MSKFIVIVYVHNKNLVIKQINNLIKSKIPNITFIILLDSYEYIHFFSNYGTVIMCTNEKYLSKKIQLGYTYIKNSSNDYNYVLEITTGFIINPEYINECIQKFKLINCDIIASSSYLIYDQTNKKLFINYSKLSEPNATIYCRCFKKEFLDLVDYKLFDFQKNENIYELSYSFCILSSANIYIFSNQYIYKIYDNLITQNLNNKSNIYLSQIYSYKILNSIKLIICDQSNIYFNNKGINQVYVSKDLDFFKDKIRKNYNLVNNTNLLEPCLFFGMYNITDYLELVAHQGLKYILWGGSDIDIRLPSTKTIINKIIQLKGINHFAISHSIQNRLNSLQLKSTLVNFSLIDQEIFNPSKINYSSNQPKKIYIYNGKKTSNPIIYNQKLVNQIIEKLSNKYTFILSSDLNVSNSQMIHIYSECFMGIRLCENDGNANTVQEMGLLGIPVLHNGRLPNSIPWYYNFDDPNGSIDLIVEKIDYIYKNFWSFKHIIADSVEKYLSEDCRENICIFVPMWHRHETTEKNIHLIAHQIYQKTKIILIYSNDSDKCFAKNLESRYSNLYSIEVENKPLSKKFQFGAEFSKIFYPKGIIINGSDDFLSLNYSKCVYDEFSSGICNYMGCNFWYVGDLESMLLYKFKYNDLKRVVGCGRSFKHDLLDNLNWQIFPLDRNSGIDGASKDMIKNLSIFKPLDTPKCFTFSFKEKTDMITPMTNLIKSDHNTYEIISEPSLLKIMYSTNLYELETTFRFQQTSISINLYLFITLLDEELKRSNPVMLNSYYMEKVIGPYFDIVDIRKLDQIKMFNYKLIFIDGIALNTRTSKLDKSLLYSLLNKIKNIPKVLLAHDIHDYSYDFDTECQPPKEMLSRELVPNPKFTKSKENFLLFVKQNNIQNIISICDCEEFDFMYKYYSEQIKKFFILSHHIPQEIFYPRLGSKIYDILIYGWSNSDIVYPFRTRLKRLITSPESKFKVHIIERTSNIKEMPIENELAEIISQSWITITCVSNFSYLVRKYFEIGACGSIPCGNTNSQSRSIFGPNMIELNQTMSDYEILRILEYYLSKPELLVHIGNQIKQISQSYNYNMFIKKMLEIKDDVVNSIPSEYEYINAKNKINLSNHQQVIHKIMYEQKLDLWYPNQKVILGNLNEQINIKLEQSISTPGIKTNIKLDQGNYLLSFDLVRSDGIKCSIFCFKQASTETKSIQILVNESTFEQLICGNFKIDVPGNYVLYILATNPQEDKMISLEKINLKKIQVVTLTNKSDYCGIPHPSISDIIFYKKITYGSISCAAEVLKLHTTFGGLILTKDQILERTWIKDSSDKLVLLGLYSPHHWQKIYKPLFDTFSRVMIIFTGTDILQLSNSKISSELKQIIYSELSKPKYILGALNERNLIEIKQTHKLDCKIISLPMGLGIDQNLTKIKNSIPNKYIACYLGDNLEWYCHFILIQVSKLLPEYTFYFYKYGGFDKEFISNPKNSGPNIIYNTQTIENFFEFMEDKFTSLRITLHDGEPMTGIETMCLTKPFIFNHKMKWSIQTDTKPEQIARTIISTYNQVVQGIYSGIEPAKYYLDRNSNRIFEKNLLGWFSLGFENVKVLDKSTNLILPKDKNNISEYKWEYKHELDPGIYNIKFNGFTSGYAHIYIKQNSKIIIESSKYSQIYTFETLSWIEFKVTEKTQVVIGLKLGYPQDNEYIQIRDFIICN